MMKNAFRRARAAGLALFMIVAIAAIGSVGPSVAGAETPVSAFYLAVGASESLGVQPTAGYPKGQRTDFGYTDDLVAQQASEGVTLDLHSVGCSGATTSSVLHGNAHCYTSPDTQLKEAISFLESHQGENGLVTIDLGFNDLLPCLHGWSTNPKCVVRQLDSVRAQLTEIIGALQAVAGPNVKFIGVGHYDPYVADSLNTLNRAGMAKWSLHVIRHLDETLRSVYQAAGIPMADVGQAFKTNETAHVTGIGTIPENVAEVCLLTWMCQPAPFGPNIHPNDAGYQIIATAIERELTPW